MKWNNNLAATFCLFVLPLVTYAGANALTKIDTSDAAFRGMDARLRAIAANPELLAKLDQRNLYHTQEAYQKVLNRGLHEITALIPASVPSSSVSNLLTALCVHDAKVFFWLPQPDQDFVGWVSLPDRSSTTVTNRMLVLWVIPHKGSPNANRWTTPQEISDNQLAEAIKEITGKNVGDIKRIGKKDNMQSDISGSMESQNLNYRIHATLSPKCLQVRMSATPEDNTKFPGKPVLEDEPLDLTKPITLPLWPPKEE